MAWETNILHCQDDLQQYAGKNHDIWKTPLKGVSKDYWARSSAQTFIPAVREARINPASFNTSLFFCYDRRSMYQYGQVEWAVIIVLPPTDSTSLHTFVCAASHMNRVSLYSYQQDRVVWFIIILTKWNATRVLTWLRFNIRPSSYELSPSRANPWFCQKNLVVILKQDAYNTILPWCKKDSEMKQFTSKGRSGPLVRELRPRRCSFRSDGHVIHNRKSRQAGIAPCKPYPHWSTMTLTRACVYILLHWPE